jgi:elongation factor Ts
MAISVDDIKELRELTSCGVIECKKALEESNGDINQAKEYLKKRGLELAAKKGSRSAKEGRIEAYIHQGGKIGVIVEVNCETDFVASNEDFVKFTKDLCMHIAALAPKYVSKDDVPEDVLKEQKDAAAFIKEACLLEQAFIKDSSKTIQELINGLIASIGENIFVSRFTRFKVNEID